MSLEQLSKAELVKKSREIDQSLKAANQRIKELESTVAVSEQKEDEIELPMNGVGKYLNKEGKPTVVTIKFNPTTGQARTDKVEVFREDHRAAYTAAKLLEETFRNQREV